MRKLILLIFLVLPASIFGQDLQPHHKDQPHIPALDRALLDSEIFEVRKTGKKPGAFSSQDWAALIDSVWGPGVPTPDKLAIFDLAWNAVDDGYGAFMNLNVDLDSLKNVYRPEIQNGVSRGRFAAIMTHLSLALKDAHTSIFDTPVSFGTSIQPGIPLFVVGPNRDNARFGAVLTVAPDSTLLVLKALPNHVLGLVPGDVVLGYDGIPWKELYRQVLAAELPISLFSSWGSTDHAMDDLMLRSAGLNWHLFDTLDVVKYNNGDTLSFPTSLLTGQNGTIWGQEQLDIPGVAWPNVLANDFVSWGIIDGTSIGYIYVTAWSSNSQFQISEQFHDAIDNLMNNHETTALIVDFRLNYGGWMLVPHAGYSLLFNTSVREVAFDVRGDPNDHFSMIPHPTFTADLFTIPGDPNTFYDKPIAVLTGPGAVSNGDWESLRMKFHPMVRTFGKSTNGAFTPSDNPSLGNPNWFFSRATGSGYLLDGHVYLAHTGVEIEEEVWFTKDDVAQGNDTVVESALGWIRSLSYAHNVTVDKFVTPGDTAVITAEVESPNNDSLTVVAILSDTGLSVLDSVFLFDDGNHHDGSAGDSLWGALRPVGLDEATYFVSIRTTDPVAGKLWLLDHSKSFTTIGPVIAENVLINSQTATKTIIDVSLTNLGATVVAPNVTARLRSTNPCVVRFVPDVREFGDIGPGQISGELSFRIETDGCQDTIEVDLVVSSNGRDYWRETMLIPNFPVVGIEDRPIPLKFSLKQNFPNPFNPVTTIRYDLPEDSNVDLKIYNVLGQEVRALISGRVQAGQRAVVWNGKNDSGSEVGSGVYVYRLRAGTKVMSRKMLLLK